VIHLSEHHGDGAPGATTMIQIRASRLPPRTGRKKVSPCAAGPRGPALGARTVTVTDPFANTLTFSEPND
jgi:hypothetical protein